MESRRASIDETKIEDLCEEIENQFSEKGIKRPLHQIFAEIESFGSFANEYVDDLRRLHEKAIGRNRDISAYVAEAYSRTGRIRRAALLWNQGLKKSDAESSKDQNMKTT